MKLKVLCLLTALMLPSQTAIAQEYSGNFWVNPLTNELESIDLSSVSPGVNPLRVARFGNQWVQVATTLQGERVEVDTISRREVLFGRGKGSVRFRTRITTASGSSEGFDRWIADCENFTLQSNRRDFIPIFPETVGEAIYNWACPS